jgi:hypothetical protein
MADIDRRHFNSAQSAFDALDGDTVPFARLAKQKLSHVGIALSTRNPFCRPGGHFNPGRATVYELTSQLMLNGDVAKLSDNLWNCVKPKGSDDVCFYSDSYDFKLDNANRLQSLCREVGLDVRIFEWDYPGCEFNQNDRYPSTTVKIIGSGYKQLYRGKLVGFVVGAYNNPFDVPKKKDKRQRE